jgi:hypothetical protein
MVATRWLHRDEPRPVSRVRRLDPLVSDRDRSTRAARPRRYVALRDLSGRGDLPPNGRAEAEERRTVIETRKAWRTTRLDAIARIEGILERGTWPTGRELTDRERLGLRRTLDAIRDELRRGLAS